MVIESIRRGAHTTTLAEPARAAMMVFGGGSVTPSPTIPAFIPADQAYYWSVSWQESERQALADIENGRLRTFNDPNDAVRYLLGNPE